MSFSKHREVGAVSVIDSTAVFEGIGLHTGDQCAVRIKGNPNEDGIFFERDGVSAKLHPINVDNSGRTTSLLDNAGEVAAMTIEHMLSAFYALRIRDAIVVLENGVEIPILNGASDIFLAKLVEISRTVVKEIEVVAVDGCFSIFDTDDPRRSVEMTHGNDDGIKIVSEVRYNDSPVTQQSYSFIYGGFDDYRVQIARAGTSYPFFIHSEKDRISLMRRLKGIRFGGPDQNVNILDPNFGSSRLMTDHVARHKILDFLGDIQVLNLPLANGSSIALKNAGHRLNNQLCRLIYDNANGT